MVGTAASLGIHPVVCDVSEAYEGPLWRNRVKGGCVVASQPVTNVQREGSEGMSGGAANVVVGDGHRSTRRSRVKGNRKTTGASPELFNRRSWNPAHRAPWFLQAVSQYDYVFSPRRATLSDLRAHGCLSACYLPFAYAPELHFPEAPTDDAERVRLASDIVFPGGADRDRVPYMQALIRTGFNVALYGGYWERYPQTAGSARGHADAQTLRKAVGAAKIALCLVRRANRDGNVMRSFELPAMGACMLTEDTVEHREILGDDGEAVTFFRTQEEMGEKLRWLLAHDDERRRLKEAAHRVITRGHHTYRTGWKRCWNG